MLYWCDSKYAAVIEALSARGEFIRIQENDDSCSSNTTDRLGSVVIGKDKSGNIIAPFGCKFLWINLREVSWKSITHKVINHFKGSQHFSNKAFLYYHLIVSKKSALCAPTWTPITHSMPALMVMLISNALYSCMKSYVLLIINKSQYQTRFLFLLRVYAALNIDNGRGGSQTNFLQRCKLLDTNSSVTELQDALSKLEGEDTSLSYCGREDVFILKPVGGSCGKSIQVIRGIENVMREVEITYSFKCIVQKYIEKPLLLYGNKKFDIRMWVLLTDLEPLIVYGFSQFYVRLSSGEYTLENLAAHIHLCNHSIQRLQSTPARADEEDCDSMMSQSQFLHCLCEQGYSESDIERLMTNVKETCLQTIDSVKGSLEKHGRGFEWLGFDLMVTPTLETVLIEVNVSPDISYSTSVTIKLVKAATNDLFRLIFDELGFKEDFADHTKQSRVQRLENTCFDEYVGCDPVWQLWERGPAPADHCKVAEKLSNYTDYTPKQWGKCIEAVKILKSADSRGYSQDDEDDEI